MFSGVSKETGGMKWVKGSSPNFVSNIERISAN